MAPLAEHLVGYLSMFLQLGVLTLLTVLAVLVRGSLGRRRFDGWTIGLGANALAILVLAVFALGRDARLIPAIPAATIAYALLEDIAAAAFIAGARAQRGARPVPWWLVVAVVVAVACTTIGTFYTSAFLNVYRIHSTFFALLLALAVFEVVRVRLGGLGARLLIAALALLTLDYAHVPALTLLGVTFPENYLGLESYVTVFLDIALGVALVVQSTDAAHGELQLRNAELARAQRALQDAAYTDALCAIPNRAAFLESIATPPDTGTVAMIDLDGLKAINDRYGHSCGDAALEMVARCLRGRCGDRGIVYRIGGDEFAGIWSNVRTAEVEAMLTAATGDLAVLGEDVVTPVRISWGLAEFGMEH
jgi:diguanylate cyclase (GGDEF)-like protein